MIPRSKITDILISYFIIPSIPMHKWHCKQKKQALAMTHLPACIQTGKQSRTGEDQGCQQSYRGRGKRETVQVELKYMTNRMVSPCNGRLAGRIGVYGVDDGLSLALLVDFAKPSAGLPVRCLPLEILLILIHIVHLQTEKRFEWDFLSLSLSSPPTLLPPLLLVLCKNRSGCASLSVWVCVCVGWASNTYVKERRTADWKKGRKEEM